MADKNFEKINIVWINKHTAIYPSTKFQSIWRKPDYGIEFAQKSQVKIILGKQTLKY